MPAVPPNRRKRNRPSVQGEDPDYPRDGPLFQPVQTRYREVSERELRTYVPATQVLLVTTARCELEAVRRSAEPLPGEMSLVRGRSGALTYHVGRLNAYAVAVVRCRQGSSGRGASLLTTKASIQFWRPRTIIAVGIAFGAEPT